MCGFAGFFDPRRAGGGIDAAVAAAMAERLKHRGPDDGGLWSDDEAGFALGFRRLAILDLSRQGHQPMVSACGRYVIAFNGEIYNYRALRSELEAAGAGPWRGHSDTEVLLAAIGAYGFVPALARLNGMFAIALWDRDQRRLWLARDRFGEKPLYYGTAGGAFLFASELKALAAHPAWSGAIDAGAIGLYLRFAYIPAPYTAFRGISKLPAGHYLTVDADGVPGQPISYWSPAERATAAAAEPFVGDLGAAAEALQALFDDAVAIRMIADVPLGAFLSGGIDSSAVVASMQHRGSAPVRTFTIGFPGTRYDESPHAEAVARHLGTAHLTIPLAESAYQEVAVELPRIYDEPFADPSQIPTVLLSRLSRAHVTCALSGDGGDELFGGYPRYREAERRWQEVARAPSWLRRGSRALVRALAGRRGALARRLRKRARRWSHERAELLYRDYLSRWHSGDGVSPLLDAYPSVFDAAPVAELSSLAQRFMVLDAASYLPDDLMVKVDRASMAAGLEARAPLLDHRLAEFAWSLPPALTVEGDGKRVLRKVLCRRVPRVLVERPKMGFEPPIGRLLREGLCDWADDLLSMDRLRRHDLVNAELVGRRWAEHRSGAREWTYPLWTVLMLEAWLGSLDEKPSAAR